MHFKTQSRHTSAWLVRIILRRLFGLLVLASFSVLAVVPKPDEQNSPNIIFKHVLPTQIAAIGYINSIAQDTQGFMWFGGASGLARYDGYDLLLFRHDEADAGSINDSYVNRVMVARDGALWVGTRKGLSLYESRLRKFTSFTISALDAAANDVIWVHEDRKGRMWLGTRGGLFSFDRNKKVATRIIDEAHANVTEASQVVWSVVDDQAGNIWVAYQSFGVSRYDPATGKFESFMRDVNLPNADIYNDTRRLYIDHENRLFAATYGDGLYEFNPGSRRFVKINHDASEKGATVWSMLVDLNDNLWVGDGSHVHVRSANTDKFYRYTYHELDLSSPGNYVVNDIFEDRAGDIWLGYFPSGIDVVDSQAAAFKNYGYSSTNPNTITDGGVSAVSEDENGNLWIGTGYGLNYFDRATQDITRISYDAKNPKGLSGSTVLSIAKSSSDTMWLGIWSGGLNRLNTKTHEFKHYLPDVHNPNSLHGREVWSVIEDRNHKVWLATEKGLNKFDPVTERFEYFLPPAEHLDGDKVLYSRVVFEDSKQRLWFGSARGLFLFDRDKKQFTRYKHELANPNSISANFVLVIYEDSRGNLWVGTDGGGLNLFDPDTGKFTAFTTKDGLADNLVGGITEDAKGSLWLGTQRGISQFDPQKRSFRNFNKQHGLADSLFSRNAALFTRKGELFMGHSKGFTLFKSDDIKSNTYVPNVVITNLTIGNKPVEIGAEGSPLTKAIESTSALQLTHKDAVFSLEFSALSFHHVEDNQYAYRLLGFEENWNHSGNRRTATYTNLNAGTYVFEVKGSNNDGVWSEYPVSLQINILPPYWRTWWAYCIYFALVAGLVYWFVHVQRLQLAFETEKLERERVMVKRLTQVDKLKDEFLANTSHELRTPLNGIIGLAESLRDGVAGAVSPEMKYHLSLIVDSGRRLAGLVNDILDFSQLKNRGLTLHKKAVDIKVLVDVVLTLSRPLVANKTVIFVNNVPQTLPCAYADEDRVLQILHNLIGNAAKFTDRGVISVTAHMQGDFIEVEVGDTGMGIPADRLEEIFESFTQLEGGVERAQGGAGLGLSVTKQLVELHGGSIRVESVPDVGSTFYFTLPTSYELPDPAQVNSRYVPADLSSASTYAKRSNDAITLSQKNNILVVDDDLINRQVISNYLSMENYNILEASCGEDALNIIANEPVDLVLLDIMMPRISGYETCRILRETYAAHELPIILLTARNQVNDLVMGFEAGANDFMVKPIVKETLIARVATHLQLLDVMRNLDKRVAERTDELNRSNAVLTQAQTELEVAYQKLEEASLTDPLTGLNNRRFLRKSIAADIAMVERSYLDWNNHKLTDASLSPPREQDLVFMLLDIDFFKSVNDNYGHNAGDKLLEQISSILKATLRESDYLVRWGGEEFLVVVRYCNRQEVPELAERIRQQVEHHLFDLGNGQRINKTCSIGMSAYPFYQTHPTALTWEQVVDTADRALYLAKNYGRNCWVNVVAGNPAEADVVNPAASDSLISLAAAGAVQIQASVPI